MRTSIEFAIRELEAWRKDPSRITIDEMLEEVLTQLHHALKERHAPKPLVEPGITHLATVPKGCAALDIRRAGLGGDCIGYALVGSISGQTYATSESPKSLLRYARNFDIPVSCLFDLGVLDDYPL
jgi:hypothetical protein